MTSDGPITTRIGRYETSPAAAASSRIRARSAMVDGYEWIESGGTGRGRLSTQSSYAEGRLTCGHVGKGPSAGSRRERLPLGRLSGGFLGSAASPTGLARTPVDPRQSRITAISPRP